MMGWLMRCVALTALGMGGTWMLAQAPAVPWDGCPGAEVGCQVQAWRAMWPPDQPVEVLLANHAGWVGLNFITMTQERVHARLRTVIPTMVPALVQVFPLAHASQGITNRQPTLYVRVNEGYTGYYTPQSAHLVRLRVDKGKRQMRVISGADVLVMHARFPGAVPLTRQPLDSDAFWIRPKKPLEPGEYLVVFGSAGGSGFELAVK
jgi:hypothetical protein